MSRRLMAGIILFWLIVSLVIEVMVMLHLHLSLVGAVNELHVCEQSDGVECHIERDWLDYNVYSY